MMCNDFDRLTLCETRLIVSFLDCCRDFKIQASEISEGLTRSHAADLGQHLTLFACAPNDYAYDGKGDHGSNSIAVDEFVDWAVVVYVITHLILCNIFDFT